MCQANFARAKQSLLCFFHFVVSAIIVERNMSRLLTHLCDPAIDRSDESSLSNEIRSVCLSVGHLRGECGSPTPTTFAAEAPPTSLSAAADVKALGAKTKDERKTTPTQTRPPHLLLTWWSIT